MVPILGHGELVYELPHLGERERLLNLSSQRVLKCPLGIVAPVSYSDNRCLPIR